MLDVTGVSGPPVAAGELATLIGPADAADPSGTAGPAGGSGGTGPTAADWATWADTNAHEIVTGLGGRIARTVDTTNSRSTA